MNVRWFAVLAFVAVIQLRDGFVNAADLKLEFVSLVSGNTIVHATPMTSYPALPRVAQCHAHHSVAVACSSAGVDQVCSLGIIVPLCTDTNRIAQCDSLHQWSSFDHKASRQLDILLL